MTMFVDRRKDNYDELLVLAHDSRASRARTNRWTTGLIVTAMAGSAAYVATMEQQVDDLRETATEAAKDRDTIQSKYTMLKAEILALTRYQDLYADIAPTQNLSNSIGKLAERLGQEPGQAGTPSVTQFALSNLVWMVDGSRRFPMTAGDILWVPEGDFWLRMEQGPNVPPNRVSIHKTKDLQESSTPAIEHDFGTGGMGTDFRLKVQAVGRLGNANCIELTWHEKSKRLGFAGPEYIDMEVLFYNNPECPEPLPPQ